MSEGNFSFDGVLALQGDEFADQGLYQTGAFGNVVYGLVGEEEDPLLDHFLLVYFLYQSGELYLFLFVELTDDVGLLT